MFPSNVKCQTAQLAPDDHRGSGHKANKEQRAERKLVSSRVNVLLESVCFEIVVDFLDIYTYPKKTELHCLLLDLSLEILSMTLNHSQHFSHSTVATPNKYS